MSYLNILFWLLFTCFSSYDSRNILKDVLKRGFYRNKLIEMTKHAYGSYMTYAFPGDELNPLSCTGRYRKGLLSEDYDDYTFGNFSLTLIDSLDTLAIMNLVDEFEHGLRMVIKHVRFDCDVYVSTFETNIRVLGGLLSAHFSALELKPKNPKLAFYSDQLLNMATTLADKLVLSFNSKTGLPYRMMNLNTGGVFDVDLSSCTACGGTMILEFGTLSVLTNNATYMAYALKALDIIWNARNSTANLVGSVIDINSGLWLNLRSGIGMEIDSYYEYLLKAYILFGSSTFLHRFEQHYKSIMKNLREGHRFIDKNLNDVGGRKYDSVDSLQAYFPAIQVIYGDVENAIRFHQILYRVSKKYKFIPESYSSTFEMVDSRYKQRPEFAESNYFLYLATQDPVYFDIAIEITENIDYYLRVSCGFAHVSDLLSFQLEDKMESFLISEMFKYLYLTFTEKSELPFDLSDYVFSTEAHLMPISGSVLSSDSQKSGRIKEVGYCPVAHRNNFAPKVINEMWNSSYGNYIMGLLSTTPKISSNNNSSIQRILKELKNIGAKILQALPNTEITPNNTSIRANILRSNELFSHSLLLFVSKYKQAPLTFVAGPALFGPPITDSFNIINTAVRPTFPLDGCTHILNVHEIYSSVAIIQRGNCTFALKIMNAQLAGAKAAIIVDQTPITLNTVSMVYSMTHDPAIDSSFIKIPSVFTHRVVGTVFDELFNPTSTYEAFENLSFNFKISTRWWHLLTQGIPKK